MLHIKWPQKISNEYLYNKTNQELWSRVVRARRLRWFGHLMRLPEETPARKALHIATLTRVRQPRGAQKRTWLSTIKADLKTLDITYDEALRLALDREEWRGVVFLSRLKT